MTKDTSDLVNLLLSKIADIPVSDDADARAVNRLLNAQCNFLALLANLADQACETLSKIEQNTRPSN